MASVIIIIAIFMQLTIYTMPVFAIFIHLCKIMTCTFFVNLHLYIFCFKAGESEMLNKFLHEMKEKIINQRGHEFWLLLSKGWRLNSLIVMFT